MKTLLFIFLLPLFAMGQYQPAIPDTIYLQGYTTQYKITAKLDTIPVIILLSDTTRQEYATFWGDGEPHASTYKGVYRSDDRCFWKYGYSVEKREQSFPLSYTRTNVKYLDSNRKPLKSGMVIWMSKEVK